MKANVLTLDQAEAIAVTVFGEPRDIHERLRAVSIVRDVTVGLCDRVSDREADAIQSAAMEILAEKESVTA